MITSMSNGQMKLVQQLIKKAKARKESGLFVVEGMKMFREAPQERIEKVYASSSFLKEAENQSVILEKGCTEKNGKLEEVDDKVFKNLSDTVTPQGILCLIKRVETPIKEILKTKDEKAPFLMILEDLQDPGNMGTILRTAEGAGVTGIILSKNCVDLYNPKVIRSTMGSIYRMPVMQADLLEILPVLKENKIQTYAAHLKGKNWYHEEDYTEGTAFFIGNEGNGLSDELSDSADCLIKIPMEGKVESLNAAMAAGILMYETARQRRTGRYVYRLSIFSGYKSCCVNLWKATCSHKVPAFP